MSRTKLLQAIKSANIDTRKFANIFELSENWVYGLTRGNEPVPQWIIRSAVLFQAAPEELKKELIFQTSRTPRWKSIPGYPLYEISSLGKVRRAPRKGLRVMGELKISLDREGYPSVKIYDANGKERRNFVHRLVALAFLGPQPADRPYVCHRDGIKTNSGYHNLYWGTPSENTRDCQVHRFTNEKRGPYTRAFLAHRRLALKNEQPQHIEYNDENCDSGN